jgi:hypothetical protein
MIDYNNIKFKHYMTNNYNEDIDDIEQLSIRLNGFLGIPIYLKYSYNCWLNDIDGREEERRLIYRNSLIYIVCRYYKYIKSYTMNKSIFDGMINELEDHIMNYKWVIKNDNIRDEICSIIQNRKIVICNKYKGVKGNWSRVLWN